MKRQIGWALAAIVTVSGIGAASAADMAVKARPAPPPVVIPGWQGFYLGVNGGGGWADTTFTGIPVTGDHFLTPLASRGTGSNSGNSNWVAGGQIGYNWQWNQFVLGLEGNYSGANVRNTTGLIVDPVFPGENIALNSKIDQYAAIVGRAGLAPTNNVLLYVRGGWAAARIATNPQDFFPLPNVLQHFSSASVWHNGWTVGAGVEFKVASNWVFGVEGNYYDFGSKNHVNPFISTTGAAVGAPAFYNQNVDTTMATIVGRVSYLFNAAPVVAKY